MKPLYPLPTSEDVPHFSAIVIAAVGFLVMAFIGIGLMVGLAVSQ